MKSLHKLMENWDKIITLTHYGIVNQYIRSFVSGKPSAMSESATFYITYGQGPSRREEPVIGQPMYGNNGIYYDIADAAYTETHNGIPWWRADLEEHACVYAVAMFNDQYGKF